MSDTIGALSPEDTRLVLDTVRRVQQSGILSPAYVDRLLNRLPRITGGDGTTLKHFILIEDVSGGTVQGRRCSPSGTGVDNNEDPTDLVNWAELLDGAKTGYVGLFAYVDDEWVLAQGPCIVVDEEE